MKKYNFLIGLLCIPMLIVSGCTAGNTNEEAVAGTENETLKIVTTIPPLYSLTAKVTEGVPVEITNLVSPGVSVHDYQMKPSDAKALESADLIVINGLELEEFLEEKLDELEGEVVVTSEGIVAMKNDEHEDKHEDKHEDEHEDEHEHEEEEEHDDEHEHEEEDEYEDGDDHGHGEFDPHVWMDPSLASFQAKNIAAALKKVDEKNAETYGKNYVEIEKELNNLKKEVRQKLAEVDVKNYIIFHDAYGYFENAFGIEHVAVIEDVPGESPSPQYLKYVVDLIEGNSVDVIFTEPQFSPELVEVLTEEHEVKSYELDPLGRELSANGYTDMIRKNTEQIVEAFL